METGILRHISTTSQTDLIGKMTENANNKIPEYATNYKKEYLFIRGINKELYLVILKYNDNTSFTSKSMIRIKNLIKKYLKTHRRGNFKDLSLFEIDYNDIRNIDELINILEYDLDDLDLNGKDFYKVLVKFYKKLNFIEYLEDEEYSIPFVYRQPNYDIEAYEVDIDGDLDSDIDGDLDSDSDSDSDSD